MPKGGGHVFENHVRNLAPSVEGLEQIILPLLDAWKMLRSRIAQLTKQLVVSVRRNEQCQLLMAVPG